MEQFMNIFEIKTIKIIEKGHLIVKYLISYLLKQRFMGKPELPHFDFLIKTLITFVKIIR